MDISIVLGSFNRCEFLKLTIAGIRNEIRQLEVECEIIVVDGGSTDGTIAWLTQQKDIICIIQHNRGEWQGKPIKRRSWGYFMNLAFKAAQGKYICMLSDDCLVIPGALVNGYKYFESRLSNGLKTGGVAFYFRDWPEEKHYHVNRTIEETIMLNHGLFLKQALERVAYINEDDYFFYHADDDLALKLKYAGYPICDAPESFIEHFLHANIVLRQSVYESERRDYKKLIENWRNTCNIPDESYVNSMIFKDYTYAHEHLSSFHKLYQRDKRRQKTVRYKTFVKQKFTRFFKELYFIAKYFAEAIGLLLTNPVAFKRKIAKSWEKRIKKNKVT